MSRLLEQKDTVIQEWTNRVKTMQGSDLPLAGSQARDGIDPQAAQPALTSGDITFHSTGSHGRPSVAKQAIERLRQSVFGVPFVMGGRDYSFLCPKKARPLTRSDFNHIVWHVLHVPEHIVSEDQLHTLFDILDLENKKAVSRQQLVDFAHAGPTWDGYRSHRFVVSEPRAGHTAQGGFGEASCTTTDGGVGDGMLGRGPMSEATNQRMRGAGPLRVAMSSEAISDKEHTLLQEQEALLSGHYDLISHAATLVLQTGAGSEGDAETNRKENHVTKDVDALLERSSAVRQGVMKGKTDQVRNQSAIIGHGHDHSVSFTLYLAGLTLADLDSRTTLDLRQSMALSLDIEPAQIAAQGLKAGSAIMYILVSRIKTGSAARAMFDFVKVKARTHELLDENKFGPYNVTDVKVSYAPRPDALVDLANASTPILAEADLCDDAEVDPMANTPDALEVFEQTIDGCPSTNTTTVEDNDPPALQGPKPEHSAAIATSAKQEEQSYATKQTAVLVDKLKAVLAKLLVAHRTLRVSPATSVDEDVNTGEPMAYVEATITSARDLPAMKKVKNSSDAYVVASIDYTAGGANDEISYNALLIPSGETYKTQTAWDTRHPRSVFGVSRGRRVVLCETEKVCACVCTCRPGKEGVSGDLFLLTYICPTIRWNQYFMMKPVQSIYGTIRFSLKDNMGTGTGRDALIGWADVKLEVSYAHASAHE